jgi:hypothetical protein
MNAKKTADENLLDAQLDFILNAPQAEFDQYLAESGADVAEVNRKAARAIDAALENHARTKQAAEALACLTPSQQKVVAQNLHIRRSVLTAFREHRVIVTSIPKRFLTCLAHELGQAVGALEKALCGSAPHALAGQHKSDIKPETVHERILFEQLLREAAMSEEEISAVMHDGG